MKKLVLLLLLMQFLSLFSNGQLDNTWMLGHFLNPIYPKCKLDFSNGIPDTFSIFRPMPFYYSNTSISDSIGKVVLYTNGIYVANKNHDTLLNSLNFNPGSINAYYGLSIPFSTLIIPKPLNSNEFFLFHKSADSIWYQNIKRFASTSLRYSMIDMTLDSGLGGIPVNEKSITLINDTLNRGLLAACKHGNGRDWWVLIPAYNDSLIYKVLVTPDTLIVTDQIIIAPIYNDLTGTAVFSPDGSKYILLSQNNMLQIFDFDRCNGILSNASILSLPDTLWAYFAAAVSSNSHYLYASTELHIFQIDLTSNPYSSSVIQVAEWDTFYSPGATLFAFSQIGPDGRIYYGTRNGNDVLHVIVQPDSSGLNCNVLQNNLKLPCRNNGVPNFPNYNLGPLYGSACDSLSAGVEVFAANNINLQIAPNPIADDVLHVTYKLPQNKSGILKVFDITGKEIFKYTLPAWSTLQNLNLPMLSDGMYFCTVSSGVYRMSKRFVVMKGEN